MRKGLGLFLQDWEQLASVLGAPWDLATVLGLRVAGLLATGLAQVTTPE